MTTFNAPPDKAVEPPIAHASTASCPKHLGTQAADATELLSTLRAICGTENVLVGDELAARASHFWDATPLSARALVRPSSTRETSSILAACHKAGQTVVAHGGITGLAGGERSTSGDLVVTLERLSGIEALDPIGRTITVGAGCVLERVQDAASAAGLQFGLDLGARGSCTIGGNIATNAGGLSVLRYGMMREQVLGLEVVLADGTIVSSMNRMLKNNAGYDLKHLFVGSEGTLGIVTRAVLRLRAPTPSAQTALVAFDRYEQVPALLAHVDSAFNGTLNAYEVIWNDFYQLNTDPQHESAGTAPLARDYPLYAIVESRGAHAQSDQEIFSQAMESAFESGLIVDAAIAQSERERANIWHLREHIDLALRHEPVFAYDISLPIVDMGQYVSDIEIALSEEWASSAFYAYGHLADGNLHLLVAPNREGHAAEHRIDAAMIQAWHDRSDAIVFGPLQALGGSVSAEHGIGLLKKQHLSRSRSPEEIALMRTFKDALDPGHLLNPGKIL